MLDPTTKIAIYMEGALGHPSGKMGYGLLRYSRNPLVAVIDSTKVGDRVSRYAAGAQNCPIVRNLEEARELKAEALVLGIAPPGGVIPEHWLKPIDQAIDLGFSIINGLHTHLAPRYAQLKPGQWIWDIRKEPEHLSIASGKAQELPNKRVLFIGSDMAVGKMTAALELHRSALAARQKAEFIATGQIGITIAGSGIALDAIRLDFACGAVENAVMAAKDAELIIIEGQGSLGHPGSTANLPLLRGACPTHLIFCHRAGQATLRSAPHIRIPPLAQLIKLYEDLSAACNTFTRPQTIAVCLNTGHLNSDEASVATREIEQELGLLTVDVVREGAARILPLL